MRPLIAATTLLLLSSTVAFGQASPFDMSGERSATPQAGDAPQTTETPMDAPAPVAPTPPPSTPPAPSPAVPDAAPSNTNNGSDKAGNGAAVAPENAIPATQPAPIATPAEAVPASAGFRRPIVPAAQLGLNGEVDRRSWSIYLTPEQATSGARLDLGYQNSVFVAPESSKLRLEVNNKLLIDEPIRSSENIAHLNFDIPAGLLQPGSNLVTLRADQRHRTDCSIDSTYQLWTNVDSAATALEFRTRAAAQLTSIDDVRAIGVDEAGQTHFNFVVPALDQPGATIPLMRLAQGLSLTARMPNQIFSFEKARLSPPKAGHMTVIVGTSAELRTALPWIPAIAGQAPTAGFVNDPATGESVLLVSGPNWQSVQAAIETIVAPTEPAHGARPQALITQNWRMPDAPWLFSSTRIGFADLGIPTTEFSGRRFRTDFTIAVPSDFYASAYGEATLLMDAAYSPDVLPGSHIDIYVNGNIASTVPINSTGGGILRQLPISVTLRHFQPGLNTIAIEAALLTNEDKACAPGATASDTPRFALFDTSAFDMPDFARIAIHPNLGATAGTGAPYRTSDTPIPVFIDRVDENSLSATATFLARLALVSGHALAIEKAPSPASVGNRSAIFVGAVSQMPPLLLSQLSIDQTATTAWTGGPSNALPSDEVDTEAAFDQWRSKLKGGTWSGQVSAFEDWLKRNFDISLSSLRLTPASDSSITPSPDTTLVIAQGPSPDNDGTWTLVTAPTGKELRDGVTALASEENWPQISGRVTTYSAGTKKIDSLPIGRFEFAQTQSPSLSNYRLIAANWLSTNILSYSVMLVVIAVALGLATASFLGNLGRRQ